DPQAQVRQQRRLDVADHLLGGLRVGGQDVDLAHLTQRGGHHPCREHPLERGEQVLGPTHAPRIGGGIGLAALALGVEELRGCGHEWPLLRRPSAKKVVHAMVFRPAALARYSARSARSSSGPSPGAAGSYSATPMLTVICPLWKPSRSAACSTRSRTASATRSAPARSVRVSRTTNSSPP